jgi:hypothetical protein
LMLSDDVSPAALVMVCFIFSIEYTSVIPSTARIQRCSYNGKQIDNSYRLKHVGPVNYLKKISQMWWSSVCSIPQ